MMTKEESTKIVNFIIPRDGVLMLGHGHINHYSEYVLSPTLSIYSTLLAIVLRDSYALFRYHHLFSFILWWAVDIQIWALLTRSQCKVSVTHLIVKARGLLFFWASHISLYFFHLKLGNKIFLRPSSSSSRSFNIQPKFNRNSILLFQLIELSPHSLSTLGWIQVISVCLFW